MSHVNSYTVDHSPPAAAAAPRKLFEGLKLITAADLDRQEFPPVSYVIPGYVAEGVTLLAGKPKCGKSWMALDWSLAVGCGGYAFGDVPVEKGDVLYLALEDNQRRLQRRVRQFLGDEAEKPSRVSFATECPTLDKGGLKAIREWCARAALPRLLVIDVLAKVRPAKHKDEGLYDADYRAIGLLKDLADEFRIAIVVVHHTSKRTDSTGPFDQVSGTTAITGACDSVIVLMSTSDGPKLYGRGRDVEEIEKAARFDKTTGRWTMRGDAEEVAKSDERRAIASVLYAAKALMGPREIADATARSEEAVRQTLGRMTKAGEVIREGRGRYRHPLRHDLDPSHPCHNGHKVTREDDDG
jgi:hypothetical protein